jgi:hypothetical protein
VPRQKKFDEDLFYEKLKKNAKRQDELVYENKSMRDLAYNSDCTHKYTIDITITDYDDEPRNAKYPAKACFVCRRTKLNHESKWQKSRYLFLF